MIKALKQWLYCRKNSRIIMVMHPKTLFPINRIFKLSEVPWYSYQGESIDKNIEWRVIKHVDFVHIKICPVIRK